MDIKKLLLASLLCSATSATMAENQTTVFATLGQGSNELAGIEQTDVSIGFGALYAFNENFAAEGRFDGFGSWNLGVIDTDLDFSAVSMGINAGIPLSDTFNIYAKLGLSLWTIEGTLLGTEGMDDGADLYFGFGARADITEQVSLGAEYIAIKTDFVGDDYSVSNLGLTLGYSF